MNEDVQEDLIFDLGLHKGFDTEFYLKKGFRVVAVEAVPGLCENAVERLAEFEGRFTIINKALGEKLGDTVSFYTVPNKDDWGSLYKEIAEKAVETSVEIEVETIDLKWLLDEFGTPYYIKCDLEGGDVLFRQQLLADDRRPTFVSIEMNDGEEGAVLAECGYDTAQIVNQWMNPFKQSPNPPLEGKYCDAQFHAEMSGLFGRELNPAKWIPIEQIDGIYRAWKDLHDKDEDLAPGWVDVHARRGA